MTEKQVVCKGWLTTSRSKKYWGTLQGGKLILSKSQTVQLLFFSHSQDAPLKSYVLVPSEVEVQATKKKIIASLGPRKKSWGTESEDEAKNWAASLAQVAQSESSKINIPKLEEVVLQFVSKLYEFVELCPMYFSNPFYSQFPVPFVNVFLSSILYSMKNSQSLQRSLIPFYSYESYVQCSYVLKNSKWKMIIFLLLAKSTLLQLEK
jgi:hypothetical protein